MKFDRKSLLLYAVTDSSWLQGKALAQDVEKALQGGATLLQIREKNLDAASFLQEAKELKVLAARYGIPLIINDAIEIAKEIDADGVHVGQMDMQAKKVRQLLGDGKIIGVTARNVEQALLAQEAGANYIGVGAVFQTGTKKDAQALSFEELKQITEAVSIPVVAIGGINADNMERLSGSGVDGVAVVSAIFAQEDIEGSAKKLRRLAQSLFA